MSWWSVSLSCQSSHQYGRWEMVTSCLVTSAFPCARHPSTPAPRGSPDLSTFSRLLRSAGCIHRGCRSGRRPGGGTVESRWASGLKPEHTWVRMIQGLQHGHGCQRQPPPQATCPSTCPPPSPVLVCRCLAQMQRTVTPSDTPQVFTSPSSSWSTSELRDSFMVKWSFPLPPPHHPNPCEIQQHGPDLRM